MSFNMWLLVVIPVGSPWLLLQLELPQVFFEAYPYSGVVIILLPLIIYWCSPSCLPMIATIPFYSSSFSRLSPPSASPARCLQFPSPSPFSLLSSIPYVLSFLSASSSRFLFLSRVLAQVVEINSGTDSVISRDIVGLLRWRCFPTRSCIWPEISAAGHNVSGGCTTCCERSFESVCSITSID